MEPDLRATALAFLKGRKTGVLATTSPSGPHARTVYFASDASFNIYFVTHTDTRKWADLEADARAAFVVSDEQVPQTLQLEGTVENLTKTALIEPALVDLAAVILSNTHYFAPLTRLNPAEMVFLKLTPTWVRWGDFTGGHGTETVLHDIAP